MTPYKTILHATDFSEHSYLAFNLAFSLAFDHGARLVLLHVVPPPAVAYGATLTARVHEEALALAEKHLEKLRSENSRVQFESRIEEGEPAAKILELAHETEADMIVLGTHGRTGLNRVVMGSVAEEVLRHATCPVVIVRDDVSAASGQPRNGTAHAQT